MPLARRLAAVLPVCLLISSLSFADPPKDKKEKKNGIPPITIQQEKLDELKKKPEASAAVGAIEDALGVAQGSDEEKKEASKKLDQIRGPDYPPEVRVAAAETYNRLREFDKGKNLADEVLLERPDLKDAYAVRAQSWIGLEKYKPSLDDMNRAIQMDANNWAFYTTRALAAYGAGNYLQALEDSRIALDLNPGDEAAFAVFRTAQGRVTPPEKALSPAHQALAREVQREYQGLLRQMSQVERTKPRASGPSREAADKISSKDYIGAVQAASKAVEQAPSDCQAYYYRAVAYNFLGKYEKAAEDASRSVELCPERNVGALNARALAHLQLGRHRDASSDANAALRLDPQNVDAYLNRARAAEKMGDKERMLADLRSAAQLNPQVEAEYRDAARAHGLPADTGPRVPGLTMGGPPARGGDGSQETSEGSGNRFLFVLVSTLAGGLLIAFGILHGLSSSKKTGRITLAGLSVEPPGSNGKTPSALESSYQVIRTLGRGGMGVVYEAQDLALERKVAIKKLRDEIKDDPRERTRFLREARLVASLHHPAIVDIYSILENKGDLYIIFEYIPGKTVDALLGEKKQFSLAEAKQILKPVCQALEFAHRNGVIHRDLKPSNVMVTDQGFIKVMDFGIARQAKDALAKFSSTNTVMGTPLYMAPEMEQGVVRAETDVYALGAMTCEMLTGKPPFPAASGSSRKLEMDFVRPSKLATDLPPDLDALIEASLQPDPDKRLGSPRKFWAILELLGAAKPA